MHTIINMDFKKIRHLVVRPTLNFYSVNIASSDMNIRQTTTASFISDLSGNTGDSEISSYYSFTNTLKLLEIIEYRVGPSNLLIMNEKKIDISG